MRGDTYFGEMPPLYALGRLSVGLFLLVFVLRHSRAGVDRELDGTAPGPKHSKDG